MHNNTEGLNPTLRAQLGVGWSRALPAPFSFGNAWKGDAVNDHFIIPSLNGLSFPNVGTIECFIDTTSASSARLIYAAGSLGGWIVQNVSSGASWLNPSSFGSGGGIPAAWSIVKNHLVFSWDISNNKLYNWRNGGLAAGGIKQTTTPGTAIVNPGIIGSFYLMKSQGSSYNDCKTDSFRFYNRILSDDEVYSNYNNGIGNNPAKTEGLVFWFGFETAESETDLWLGSSPAGWTTGAWGVRDKSGNNNHCMQVNQANNATLGGTLVAW